MLFCMPSMRVPCSPKYFSAIRCFPFNKCKDDLFIGWGHAEGTVPHGLQSATWRVSDHCYQPWRRQLSPSHSGNKSSFQMFWRFELGLNYKIWIWIGKWTVSWLISIIVTCSLKYLLSDLNCCIKKKKTLSATPRKLNKFIFMHFRFMLCSRWSLFILIKVSHHIVS